MQSVHYLLTFQGSAVGPYAFITCVNDYKTFRHSNYIFKYADDFSLLAPENSDVSASYAMAHITSWSDHNKLKINLSKCRQLVFKKTIIKKDISLCTLTDVARVNSVKLLRVYLDCTFCFHKHVPTNCKKL